MEITSSGGGSHMVISMLFRVGDSTSLSTEQHKTQQQQLQVNSYCCVF